MNTQTNEGFYLMQTEDGLKSTFTQQLVKALLQSKIVNKDIDNITEAQSWSLSLFL